MNIKEYKKKFGIVFYYGNMSNRVIKYKFYKTQEEQKKAFKKYNITNNDYYCKIVYR
tara:strand:- start:298 stop:468 length:171 start_codon:yes stop_codon:yes gene_type:complete